MRTYQEVKELISKYTNEKSFTGGVSEERIKKAEEALDVKFPEQYRWFLSEYGYGCVLGITIEGIALEPYMTVVDETRRLRDKFHLDKNSIVIEGCDEYYECLDTITGKVFDWDRAMKSYHIRESFLDYLYEELDRAIENYEYQKELEAKGKGSKII